MHHRRDRDNRTGSLILHVPKMRASSWRETQPLSKHDCAVLLGAAAHRERALVLGAGLPKRELPLRAVVANRFFECNRNVTFAIYREGELAQGQVQTETAGLYVGLFEGPELVEPVVDLFEREAVERNAFGISEHSARQLGAVGHRTASFDIYAGVDSVTDEHSGQSRGVRDVETEVDIGKRPGQLRPAVFTYFERPVGRFNVGILRQGVAQQRVRKQEKVAVAFSNVAMVPTRLLRREPALEAFGGIVPGFFGRPDVDFST